MNAAAYDTTAEGVAGTGGQTPTGGSLDHPVMFLSLNVLGSLVLDVDGARLDAVFIDDSYRERVDVMRNVGAKVFDVDGVESLLDWRM